MLFEFYRTAIKANEPTHELMSVAPSKRATIDLIPFVFITFKLVYLVNINLLLLSGLIYVYKNNTLIFIKK